MIVKGINFDDFVNYKKPSMFVIFPNCSFKCDKECGRAVCQNSALALSPNYTVPVESIIERYLQNPITKALVCGGLEPFDSWEDLQELVKHFRITTQHDIVIYTGYTEEEIKDKVEWLKAYSPLIIKFGRYIPNDNSRFEEILGVDLASSNQYAKEFKNENHSKS